MCILVLIIWLILEYTVNIDFPWSKFQTNMMEFLKVITFKDK